METTESPLGKALAGVKVLDLTQFESGASATLALAWLGADVIKIEEPIQGDRARSVDSSPGLDSYYFLLLNCNKRSVTLNLRDERGKEMLRAMIPKADVLVENFGPGVLEGLGFSYEEVSRLNPRILYAQIRGFGGETPYADFPWDDGVAQAMGGSVSTTGAREGGPPVLPGVTLGDMGTGLHLASGVLAALIQRLDTGRGQRVEVAVQDAVINQIRILLAFQYLYGRPAERVGNHNALGSSAPSNAYPCKPFGYNDYVYMYSTRASNRHWEHLLRVMGREDLIGDPRFDSPQLRADNEAEVDAVVAPWCAQHTKWEILALVGDGSPAGPVADTRELMEDEYLRRRGMFVPIQHPQRGEVVVPGWPPRMSGSPVEITRPPLLGEHNVEVYREWLGLRDQQLAELKAERVI